MKRAYRKFKKHEKTEKNEKNVDTSADSAEVSWNSDGELVLVTVSSRQFEDSYIMDSRCTYHMCPNRDWFDTFQICSGGTVLMGSDIICPIEGIGSVNIKMFDGVVRKLQEVKYVP